MELMKQWNKLKFRLQKHAYKTKAHTLLFDLEDGCRMKEMSRKLLLRRAS